MIWFIGVKLHPVHGLPLLLFECDPGLSESEQLPIEPGSRSYINSNKTRAKFVLDREAPELCQFPPNASLFYRIETKKPCSPSSIAR